jgi:hypothetical protein
MPAAMQRAASALRPFIVSMSWLISARGGQRVAHLKGYGDERFEAQGLAAREPLERLSRHVLHSYEVLRVGVGYLINRADVRVVERGGEPRLSEESITRDLIGDQVGRKQLEDYYAVKRSIECLVDAPHSAATQLLLQAIMRDHSHR